MQRLASLRPPGAAKTLANLVGHLATGDEAPARGLKYVPLTSRTALLMFGRGFVTIHREFDADRVTDLNLGTTARTERFAIAHSRAVLESLVSTTGIDLGGTGPRIRVQ